MKGGRGGGGGGGGWGGGQIKIASTVINDQLIYVNNIHFPEKLIYFVGDGSGRGTHIDS